MVIWLLGLSGVGKTTLGTLLEVYLKSMSVPVYRIDGDEVRELFDRDLGYSIKDREQNMKRLILGAYLLSKNNIVTIVCAVTPKDAWRATARKKILGYHEIYLTRNIEMLKQNDVKGVYKQNLGKTQIAGVDFEFDIPNKCDLIINTDNQTEVESFSLLRNYVDKLLNIDIDTMYASYWREYYRKNNMPFSPTHFSQFVIDFIDSSAKNRHDLRLIELGCGNGRDAVFFAKHFKTVTAVDLVEEEIEFLSREFSEYENLHFSAQDFTRMSVNEKADIIYSRFTWHTITSDAETRVLDWAKGTLNVGGKLFIECRSDQDKTYANGQRISDNESITDHYRRFMNVEAFKSKATRHGFTIVYAKEQQGWAMLGSDNPIIARIVLEKSNENDSSVN